MAEANIRGCDSAAATSKHKHWDGLISQRSQLFYDGTYRWDGKDGFWDDTGIHHDFNDPNDPEAYPPTPRPVGLWLEEGEDVIASEGETDDLSAAGNQSGALRRDRAQVQTKSVNMDFLAKFTREGPKAILIDGNVRKQKLLRDDLFMDHPNRQRLLGQIEGMIVGQQMLVDGHNLFDSYKLCGMEAPSALLADVDGDALSPAPSTAAEAPVVSIDEKETPGVVSKDANRPEAMNEDVQMKSEGGRADVKEANILSKPSFGSSPLSECPSDLSEWEVEDQSKPSRGSESNSTSHESRKERSKRSTKTKSRRDSVDSAIELPAKRRSTRIFLQH